MILEIFSILVLCVPLFWELWDDRNGDYHGKHNNDWLLRGMLMLVASAGLWLVNPHHNFIQYFILSFAIFTALFPYLVNIVHLSRGVTEDRRWWCHWNDKSIPDKWFIGWDWYYVAFLYAVLLGAAIKIYICWDSLKAWNGCQ